MYFRGYLGVVSGPLRYIGSIYGRYRGHIREYLGELD